MIKQILGLVVMTVLFIPTLCVGINAQNNQSHLQADFNHVAQSIKPVIVSITSMRLNLQVNRLNLPQNGVNFGRPLNQNTTSAKKIGSGIIIDSQGYILTNYHVIDQANDIHVTLFGLEPPVPGHFYEAQVVKGDINTDSAIIKIIPHRVLPVARLGNSDTVQLGDWILAIGSPFGFDQTISAGIISAKRRSLMIEGRTYSNLLQTDASINQGNSGGPLVNMAGEVVGINTAIYSPNGVFAGVGFAIPINQAGKLINETIGTLPDVRQNTTQATPGAVGVVLPCPGACPGCPLGTPQQGSQNIAFRFPQATICPYCGVQLDSQGRCPLPKCQLYGKKLPSAKNVSLGSNPVPTPQVVNQIIFVVGKRMDSGWLGTYLIPLQNGQNGLGIVNVVRNSPAAKAGIMSEDVIIGINGKKVTDVVSFDNIIDQTKPGNRIKLVVTRQGKKKAIYVRLGRMP